MIKKVITIFLLFLLVPVACSPTAEEEISMEDAIDVVVKDTLPNIPEIQEGNPYWCLKLDHSLSAGTVIEEDSGSTLRITLEDEMFFFYLDLAPGDFYAHDVKYILVDKDGNHEEYDAQWWPRIDGEFPEELASDELDERRVIATNVQITRPTGTSPIYDFPVLRLQRCEGFLVVQGMMPWEDHYMQSFWSCLQATAFFTSYKNECSVVKCLVESEAAGVLGEIEDMAEDGLNPITIFIVAHGDIDAVRLSYQIFWSIQFRNTMAAHPDTTFNFMLGSCHSGSFVDDLETLDNVCVVVTAVTWYQNASRDWDIIGDLTDFNPDDLGCEWTSSILTAMAVIASDTNKFNVIRETALKFNVSETCVLIYEAFWGSLGWNSAYDMYQDLDITHRSGNHDPCYYCSYDTGSSFNLTDA